MDISIANDATEMILHSIISPSFLAGQIGEHYQLNTKINCTILRLGINHSYLIQSGSNKYIFRVYTYQWRSREEIEEELRVLDLLKDHGITVSYPIADRTGHYIQTIDAPEGERFAVLFSYAKGAIVNNFSANMCFELGKLMAKMHAVTINLNIARITYNADSLINWVFAATEPYFPSTSASMQYIKRAAEVITKQFARADQSQLRDGVVHLDLWQDNMKVGEDSTITLFDFDNCGKGWLLLDIAYSTMLMFKNEADQILFAEKQNRFFEGYTSISPISSEEIRLLPYGGLAIWLHYTGIHTRRYNDFSNPFFRGNFLDYWINTVDKWMEFNDIVI